MYTWETHNTLPNGDKAKSGGSCSFAISNGDYVCNEIGDYSEFDNYTYLDFNTSQYGYPHVKSDCVYQYQCKYLTTFIKKNRYVFA